LISIDSADYQLIRTAAGVLRNPPDRHQASDALLKALARLTAEGKDTSREVRLEILDRLKEMAAADPGATNPLYVVAKTFEGYLKDFDPLIASAAADILGLMDNGKRPTPKPTRRPQELDEKLLRTPRAQTLHLDVDAIITLGNPGDTLEIVFLPQEAPLTAAHFQSLILKGYYDNQKIYKVVPSNFFATGSPQANEFSGQPRFLRNEVGSERHTLGAIAMLTHGLDTGNAQFFIDLGRHPEWDDDYTVVARVLRCYKGFVEQPRVNCLGDVLEGTKLTRIDIVKH
jgi:cyclophilin family peptidyl-prolyl cis-trans isomerase